VSFDGFNLNTSYPKEHAMKRAVLILSLLLAGTASAQVNHWNNSPNNWDNSANYWNAANGVYNNQGNQIGYETQSPSGVTNVFDNNGNRMGYLPSQKQ
jgi:hypothetical protein